MRKILIRIGAILLCLSLLAGCGTSHEGEAKTAAEASAYKGMDYQAAAESFEKRGFTAVSTVALGDLDAGRSDEDGKVEAVSIGGDGDFLSDSWYPADSEVIITYHSLLPASSTDQAEAIKSEETSDQAGESKETEENAASEQDENAQSSDSTMPVMKGTSLDSAAETAGKYGLSQVYDDEDFGHGTTWRTMSTDDGGLMVDIIYSAETGEILMGAITTSSAGADEQISFIKSMSKVLSPEASSDDVESWVASNIGDSANTTIDGFMYQLGTGSVNNVFFFAGQQNWEEWELSHYE